MKWKNELTEMLKISYPVIQSPMLGITTPEMVAAVSASGGLGSLPVGSLSNEQTAGLIHKTKSLTNAPFAVNLFLHSIPEKIDDHVFNAMQDFLQEICIENNLAFKRQSVSELKFNRYHDQINCLLEAEIPVVSFTFGVPDEQSINALKNRGTVLIGTATSLEEAEVLNKLGIDIVTAQGREAGGHRGSFLNPDNCTAIELTYLVPDLVQKINRPIVAAGGICDGPTIHSAFSLGAKAVQIGTAFIGSNESAASAAYKKALHTVKERDVIFTKALSGRWAGGIRNRFIELIEKSNLTIPEFPYQGALTAMIRLQAKAENNIEFDALFSGQSAARTELKPAAEIFMRMILEAGMQDSDLQNY